MIDGWQVHCVMERDWSVKTNLTLAWRIELPPQTVATPDSGNPDSGNPRQRQPQTVATPDSGNPRQWQPKQWQPQTVATQTVATPDSGNPDSGNPDTGNPRHWQLLNVKLTRLGNGST